MPHHGMPEREKQKKLRFLLKGYEEGWLKYEPREKKEIDFNKYTIAQVNEINKGTAYLQGHRKSVRES